MRLEIPAARTAAGSIDGVTGGATSVLGGAIAAAGTTDAGGGGEGAIEAPQASSGTAKRAR